MLVKWFAGLTMVHNIGLKISVEKLTTNGHIYLKYHI